MRRQNAWPSCRTPPITSAQPSAMMEIMVVASVEPSASTPSTASTIPSARYHPQPRRSTSRSSLLMASSPRARISDLRSGST
ncbi:MAG: hypothetical protein M5U28_29230 [Sandaracinaceae bacterium]|nr:hypothetical protein [Sandaracinaceae bacterium]